MERTFCAELAGAEAAALFAAVVEAAAEVVVAPAWFPFPFPFPFAFAFPLPFPLAPPACGVAPVGAACEGMLESGAR